MSTPSQPPSVPTENSDHIITVSTSPRNRVWQPYQQFGPNLYLYKEASGVTDYLYFVVKSGQPNYEANIDIEGDGYGRGGFITFLKGPKEENEALGQILAGDYTSAGAGDFPLMLDSGFRSGDGIVVTAGFGSYVLWNLAFDWDRLEPVIRDQFGYNILSPSQLGTSVKESALEVVGPLQWLDVAGSTVMQGDLTVNANGSFQNISTNSIIAGTYLNLPPVNPSELLPLTLDNVDNKVGINNIDPQFDLDVGGNIRGDELDINIVRFEPERYITTGIQDPENTVFGDIGSLFLRTDPNGTTPNVAEKVLYVKTEDGTTTGWKAVPFNGGSGPVDLTPLTLDKTNNRVGINNINPAWALDVTGNINTTQAYKIAGKDFVASRNTGAVAVGFSAGTTGQGINTVAIGESAAATSQQSHAVAVGYFSGNDNQGSNCVAVGVNAGLSKQQTFAVAVGANSGKNNQGSAAVAIGNRAGETNQHANSIVLNASTVPLNSDGASRFYVKPIRNENSTQSSLMNYNATTGEITYGVPGYSIDAIAIGRNAGWGGGTNVKQAANGIAIGNAAGTTSQGERAVAIGLTAGSTSQGYGAVAIGSGAGYTNQGAYSIAIGLSASSDANAIVLNATGQALTSGGINRFCVKPIRTENGVQSSLMNYNTTTGEITCGVPGYNVNAIAIGSGAGWGGGTNVKQGERAVAIGFVAGSTSQGYAAVAVGTAAGQTGQGAYSIAIGNRAGETNQHANSIVLNATTSAFNTEGTYRLYIKPIRTESGVQSALMNYNFTTGEVTYGIPGYSSGAVAIGLNAGWGTGTNVKQARDAVAIGNGAAVTSQNICAVAIGFNAGNTSQQANTVAIGNLSGNTTQSQNAVAVGSQAGKTTQGFNSVAIGTSAGQDNQGSNAIAIGFDAGFLNQHEKSIILNATGGIMNSDGANRFYVKPVRQDTTASTLMGYNSTTGEITYGSPGFDPLPITLDKTNNRVGINKTTPTQALDITGNLTLTGKINEAISFFTDASGAWTGIRHAPEAGWDLRTGNIKCDLFESDMWQFNKDIFMSSGPDNPEGTTPAGTGSIWFRTDATGPNDVMYVKTPNANPDNGWMPVQLSGVPPSPVLTTTSVSSQPIDSNPKSYCTTTLQKGIYTATVTISTPQSTAASYEFNLVATGLGYLGRRLITATSTNTGAVEETITVVFEVTAASTSFTVECVRYGTATTVSVKASFLKHK